MTVLRWEQEALERSLEPARARSAAQVRRLVDAARELAAEVGPAFTVQQVAGRSGVSLKTLYRSFPGKDALLLAVFEEDNRRGADALRELIDVHEAAIARVRAFITGLFELSTARPDEGYVGLVMREYFRLSQHHSEQVEHVLAPFIDLLEEELGAAAAAGVVRLRDPRRDAAAVFSLVVSHVCPLVLGGGDSAGTAQFVADFCMAALCA